MLNVDLLVTTLALGCAVVAVAEPWIVVVAKGAQALVLGLGGDHAGLAVAEGNATVEVRLYLWFAKVAPQAGPTIRFEYASVDPFFNATRAFACLALIYTFLGWAMSLAASAGHGEWWKSVMGNSWWGFTSAVIAFSVYLGFVQPVRADPATACAAACPGGACDSTSPGQLGPLACLLANPSAGASSTYSLGLAFEVAVAFLALMAFGVGLGAREAYLTSHGSYGTGEGPEFEPLISEEAGRKSNSDGSGLESGPGEDSIETA